MALRYTNILYCSRQKYWIVNGREVVRTIIQQCWNCIKAKPKLKEQKISDFLENRTDIIQPILHCKVDYCGSFSKNVPTIEGQPKLSIM